MQNLLKTFSITFTLILFFITPSYATEYYVSPNGNDLNDGMSPTAAFQTLMQVNSLSLLPGDTILFEGGKVFDGKLKFTSNGTFDTPIVVASYNGIATIRTLNNPLSLLIEDASHYLIKDLIFEGDYIASTDNSDAAANANAGISIIAKTQSIENFRIENVEVLKFKYHGIKIRADLPLLNINGITILNSIIHDCGYAGIFTKGETNQPIYNIQNLLIERCTVFNNTGWSESAAGNGILIGNARYATVRYSEAHHNGGNNGSNDWDNDGEIDPGLSGFGGGGGIWAVNSSDILFEYCESHHNETDFTDGNGFDMDGGVVNGIMQFNYSHDNEGGGFVVFQYDPVITNNITIRYNISENDGQNDEQIRQGVFHIHRDTTLNNFNNIFIYNNTVINDNPNVPIIKTRNGGIGIDNFAFLNNVMIHPNGGKLYDHNGNILGINDVVGNQIGEIDHFLSNFIDPEEDSAMLNSPGISGNIGLIFTALSAYQPLPNSPLIDSGVDINSLGIAGTPSPNPTTDILGNTIPSGENFDIGALEMDIMSSSQEMGKFSLNVYPNPFTDIIYLSVDKKPSYKVNIYNLEGHLIKSSINAKQIDLKDLPVGTYLIEINDLNSVNSIVQKITKSR